MSKFQGYAQENRGFNPIQVPDTSRRILEQAEETVRGLQAVRDADIANTAAYLNSFNEAMEQERESFSENSRLMNLNAEVRKDNLKASNKVRAGGDIKKMKTLKQQLEKLNSLGGLNKIVPVEGIVFKYKGKTYKFTGAFAPVNQILGLVSF